MRFIGYSVSVLAFLALGVVHVAPAIASSMPSSSGHNHHSALSCQTACQVTPQKPEETITHDEDDKDDDKDVTFAFNEVELINSGVGLLRESAIWKQSS